jgi:hypothetical protein
MATKLRKLVINEISLVDKGANQHAFITLFKRDAPKEIETPRDSDRNFNATGAGPATDRLWTAYDNRRRALGPGRDPHAFAQAWDALTDDQKQAVRNEEAAVEAARQAQAAAAEKERQAQMNKDDAVMVKAARAISAGTIENTVRKSTWHAELRKLAAARQEDGETIEQATARLAQTDNDARALFKASLSGIADDYVDRRSPNVAPKFGPAMTALNKRAEEIRQGTSMTREAAIAKIATLPAERSLWDAAKSEQLEQV